jgi:hypothetical protein
MCRLLSNAMKNNITRPATTHPSRVIQQDDCRQAHSSPSGCCGPEAEEGCDRAAAASSPAGYCGADPEAEDGCGGAAAAPNPKGGVTSPLNSIGSNSSNPRRP